MFSCKELLGLSLLSLYEGELLGVVDKLYFDKDLKRLLSISLVGEDGTRWVVPSKSIYHIGPNAITIKNKQSTSLELSADDTLVCPLGNKVYSIEGEYLGLAVDIAFDQKFRTNKIYLDNGTSEDIENLTSCGKSTLIFSKNKIKSSLFGPKTTTINQSTKPAAASKLTLKRTNYIGRICTKDIVGFNNELLIRAGTPITKKHIAELKKYNKLNELKLYAN